MTTERAQVMRDFQRFENALKHELDETGFQSESIQTFFARKSTTFCVTPNMFIPSFLISTSNAMGMATVSNIWKQFSYLQVNCPLAALV